MKWKELIIVCIEFLVSCNNYELLFTGKKLYKYVAKRYENKIFGSFFKIFILFFFFKEIKYFFLKNDKNELFL